MPTLEMLRRLVADITEQEGEQAAQEQASAPAAATVHVRAPKLMPLTEEKTITSFERWKSVLIYSCSLNQAHRQYILPGATWGAITQAAPLSGYVDIPGGLTSQALNNA